MIAHCKQRVAAYKYPRRVELVNELPKTVTGKVLRRELRSQAAGAGLRPGRGTGGSCRPVPRLDLPPSSRPLFRGDPSRPHGGTADVHV
jgi:hypothetical protein